MRFTKESNETMTCEGFIINSSLSKFFGGCEKERRPKPGANLGLRNRPEPRAETDNIKCIKCISSQ